MFLVCYGRSEDNVIKRSFDLDRWKPLLVRHHSDKLGDHIHFRIRNIMSIVAEEQDSLCSCLNPLLLFIVKVHACTKFYNKESTSKNICQFVQWNKPHASWITNDKTLTWWKGKDEKEKKLQRQLQYFLCWLRNGYERKFSYRWPKHTSIKPIFL